MRTWQDFNLGNAFLDHEWPDVQGSREQFSWKNVKDVGFSIHE